MKINFYLKYHTHFGETLYITGNVPELGLEKELVEMQYFNDDYWRIEVNIDTSALNNEALKYAYVFKGTNGELVHEFQQTKRSILSTHLPPSLKVYDIWNFAGAYGNVFYTAPFQQVLLPKRKPQKIKIKKSFTHIFKVKAPLLAKDEVVGMLGNIDPLHHWNENDPLLLQFDGEHWVVGIDLSEVDFPVAYKYGIYNRSRGEWVKYEAGGNRVCFEPVSAQELILMHDGFIHVPDNTWRGSGVSVPIFSLRSNSGLGIGEFCDLKLLIDWAEIVGFRLIQILPVNDTTATYTWKDSYPYAAISAFALHPIYINLEKVAGKKYMHLLEDYNANCKQLNDLPTIDYEAVLKIKLEHLRVLFDVDSQACFQNKAYQTFFEINKHWLKPYAAFCYLRDKYKSPDPTQWQTHNQYAADEVDLLFEKNSEGYQSVHFHCYVQYHLHVQLLEAVEYAHKKGIILKGDIPIGVYRYGCDVWVAPELYNMQLQAGAPPDNFAVTGQNWGFPTYNWARMQEDDFAWWQQRFKQMSSYFDAFRIDHILGFFRIWSIPIHAVQGVMGKFDPCMPVHVNEFGEHGIWFDYERFCEPYITDEVLNEIFSDRAEYVKEHFLQKSGPHQYRLLPHFDTQRKVEDWFKENEGDEKNVLQNGLYSLISNVILFEQENSNKTEYHFRIAIDQTTSFRHLQPFIRQRLWHLYIDYFYYRQNDFWRKESFKKLPRLKAVTNMLVCGEDLGMVPESVPGVMSQVGILSLEVQRMPKKQGTTFFNPAHAPYLSVVTPSTHDMSTIRGWWQEDRSITQQFYSSQLGQGGEAPYYCEPWINRAIILQHLHSPAMWSIFQLQDVLGMSDNLRRENPEDERINIPANPQHFWRYRMHITLEQLVKENEFNKELKRDIQNSGR